MVSRSLRIEIEETQRRAQTKRSSSKIIRTPEETDLHVREELDRLPRLERGALQVLWAELFGSPPNLRLRRELLMMVLTYRIQERAYGGLKPATRKKLLSFAEGFTPGKEVVSIRDRVTKPGTRIVREWGSKLHEVVVTNGGFSYEGKPYRSLSEIAREITGTRWSGPVFFGLKKRGKGVAA